MDHRPPVISVSYTANLSLAAEGDGVHIHCCCLTLQLAGFFRVVQRFSAGSMVATAWRHTVSHVSFQ